MSVTPLRKTKPRPEKPHGTYRHANMVLEAFDRLEHQDRRDFLERKAEAERESRRRL